MAWSRCLRVAVCATLAGIIRTEGIRKEVPSQLKSRPAKSMIVPVGTSAGILKYGWLCIAVPWVPSGSSAVQTVRSGR